MSKKIVTFLSVLLLCTPGAKASRFGDGFGVGAFTGFVGGLITSKIASTPPSPVVYVYEDPCYEARQAALYAQEQEMRAARMEQRRRMREVELERREAERQQRIAQLQQLEAEHQEDELMRERQKLARKKKLRDSREITIVETKTISKPKDTEKKRTGTNFKGTRS